MLLYIRRASQVVTVRGASFSPKTGRELGELGVVQNGSIIARDNRIAYVGDDDGAAAYLIQNTGREEVRVVEAAGRVAAPGLIDPHTHLVFAGSREDELEQRIKGASYMDIMRAGGGIHASARHTRETAEDELVVQSRKRLDRLLLHGVTTVEAKSGYGLTVEDELKQLRAARRLHNEHPVDIVSTFMGAHAVPTEFRDRPDKYVDLVCERMMPAVARERLAEFCDVFCEHGVFTPEQSRRVLEAGKRWGLRPKIHADEIEPYGGAELAAEIGAVSAEHLLRASETGIAAMAKRGVIAVLLPGTAFFLMVKPADARGMIAAGVPIALSTDCNPGSSPTVSLPFVMNLACLTMGMTPAETFSAATINAAHAIGRADRIGSLETGKQADIVLFDAPNYQTIHYHYGVNLVDMVVKNGRIVVSNGRLTDNEPME